MHFKTSMKSLACAAALAAAGSVSADNILFAFVGNTHYVADGQNLANDLAAGGHTVTQRFLNAAVYNDLSSFDQIWVYDLNATADNSAIQNANYTNIANWYNGLTNQNIIVDGRIISSADWWTNSGGRPDEAPMLQSFANALEARGGGLFLGTDHAPDFVQGINSINQQIGIGNFTGFYGSYPYSAAVVDVASPLYSTGYGFACGDQTCINDNSTTSFVPAGLQANGQFLTPFAYHGTVAGAYNNAAIATNIGSITFGTAVPEPGTFALMGLGLVGMAYAGRRRSKK
jgi:PEP-CTERM motif